MHVFLPDCNIVYALCWNLTLQISVCLILASNSMLSGYINMRLQHLSTTTYRGAHFWPPCTWQFSFSPIFRGQMPVFADYHLTIWVHVVVHCSYEIIAMQSMKSLFFLGNIMIILGQKSILVLNVGPSFSCYLRIRFNLTEPCNFIVTFFIHSNLVSILVRLIFWSFS